MIKAFGDVWKIPDLRKKILFTLVILIVYRIGSHIPCPGVNTKALTAAFEAMKGSVLGLYDVFVGGNLSRATIFALGIMPYISASIILQILGVTIPYYQKLAKEGEEGRRKMNQHTRYLTVLLAAINSFGIAAFLQSLNASGQAVVPFPGPFFVFSTMVTMTAGTIFVMWLGELITDKGIGNGISLIIMIGILARFPNEMIIFGRELLSGIRSWIFAIFFVVFAVLIIASVVIVTQAQRRIQVQYARRVIGGKIYGGQSTHLPLNVNAAGVIPIIFAQSALMIIPTFANIFNKYGWAQRVMEFFSPSSIIYNTLYVILIIVFAYVYTAIVINPQELAENMKKYGGFIPGIRPGKQTADYIDKIIARITLPGAIFFAFIAILPSILITKFHLPFYFGGTSLLIVVGVALDTVQQLESQLLMRHYDGFVKRGKIRGRRR
uniref:Protein translocase subunit SecY n=1 Tax=candidate division WOR-3 bacterium TaxID=2052148 RepID=A0A7C4UH86_UNCW3